MNATPRAHKSDHRERITYVWRTLHKQGEDDGGGLHDYQRRVLAFVPKADNGGLVFVQHPLDDSIVWIDAAVEGRDMAPKIQTMRRYLWALALAGYEFAATDTWQDRRFERYWQRVGLELIDEQTRRYSICLTPQSYC